MKKLLLPFEPNDFLETLAKYKKENPKFNISNIHFFPLGGIIQMLHGLKMPQIIHNKE